jgi:pyruvate/2-oxoglutarate/acetoin dehydrogenase E1 component
VTDEITYSAAFREGVREEMARNDRVFVLGTDLFHRGGHFAQVLGLGQEFGRERIRDAPISEAAMVAAGVGAALNGMRPLIDLNFVDFAFGAMDEIVNQAAKMRYMTGRPVPLVVRASSGIALGGAQHNNCLEGWFAGVPGLTVVHPATPRDAKGMLKTALRGEEPVIILMHKRLSALRGPVGGVDDLVAFGQAAIRRAGSAVTLISYGGMVGATMEAAEALAQRGTEAEVIDLRSLSPLDMDTITSSVRKTGRAVVIDEAPAFATFPAEVAAAIAESSFEYLDAPVIRVGAARAAIGASPPLIEAVVPHVQDILDAVERSFAAFSSSETV